MRFLRKLFGKSEEARLPSKVGKRVKLWLPENWFGGDPSGDASQIIDQLRLVSPSHIQAIQTLVISDPAYHVFFAFCKELSKSGFLTHLLIGAEEMPPQVSAVTYLDMQLKTPSPNERITSRPQAVTINQYEAGRAIVANRSGTDCLMYVIKDGYRCWNVTFNTRNLSTYRQVFEQIISSFEVSN